MLKICHCPIICALEIIYIHYTCVVELSSNGDYCVFFPLLFIQGHHIGSLMSTMVWIFTPWKLLKSRVSSQRATADIYLQALLLEHTAGHHPHLGTLGKAPRGQASECWTGGQKRLLWHKNKPWDAVLTLICTHHPSASVQLLFLRSPSQEIN